MRKMLCAVLLVLFAVSAAAAADVSEKKQTKLGKYATAEEALAMWEKNPQGVAVIDIRPEPAYYYFGHPAMAANVPYRFWTGNWNEEKKTYTFRKNAAFVEDVAARYGKDTVILVLSKNGINSADAINDLAAAGFTEVFNITDGFDGWKKLRQGQVSEVLDPALVYVKKEKAKTE